MQFPQVLVIAFLSLTLLIVLWRGGRSGGRYDFAGVPSRARIAAYEDMWRAEEAELWRWLEERVGGERAWLGHEPVSSSAKKPLKIFDRLDDMGEQEVGEAIRVTKEKLGVLEEALKARVEKKAPVKVVKEKEKVEL